MVIALRINSILRGVKKNGRVFGSINKVHKLWKGVNMQKKNEIAKTVFTNKF